MEGGVRKNEEHSWKGSFGCCLGATIAQPLTESRDIVPVILDLPVMRSYPQPDIFSSFRGMSLNTPISPAKSRRRDGE